MKTKIALLVSLILLLESTSFAQVIYDQSFRDLSFVKFKNQLTEAIIGQDTGKLFPLLADEVHVSDKCSYAPKDCFMEEFRHAGPDRDKLWSDMLKAISLGF